MNCPNINSKAWQSLEQEFGKDKAYLAFFRNNGEMPNIETARSLIEKPFTTGGDVENLPKYIQHFNIEKTSDLEQRAMIVEQIAKHSKSIEKARGTEVRKWDEVERLSKVTGVLSSALQRRVGQALSDVQLRALSDATETTTRDLTDLFKKVGNKIREGTATDRDLLDLAQMEQINGFMLAQATGAGTEAGRALAILRQMRSAERNAEMMKNLMASLRSQGQLDRNKILAVLKDIESSDDPFKINKTALHKKIYNGIYEAWLNWGLLSSPTTHAANIISNALTSTARTLFETPVSSLVEPIVAKIQKRKRERFFGDVKREIGGNLASLSNIFKAGKEGFNEDKIQGMLNAITEELKKAERFDASKIEQDKRAIKGSAGDIVRLPTTALRLEDLAFKSWIYNGSVAKRAYQQAMIEKLNGERLDKRVDEIVNNVSKNSGDELTQSIREKALDDAEYGTYTKQLGEIGSAVMNLRNKSVIGSWIVPFIKTPLNILKYGLERLPVSGELMFLNKLKKGEIKSGEISDQLAKVIIGHLMSIPIVSLAANGLISGSGPKDPDTRKTKMAVGWKPQSIKIGDSWYGYQRLEPISTILGTAADYEEISEYIKSDDELSKKATQIAFSITKNITSKTFLDQFSNLLGALEEPDRYGEAFIRRFETSLIPSVVRSVASSQDKYIRQATTMKQAAEKSIPGLQENVPPLRDIMGKPVEKEGGFLWKFLVPIAKQSAKTDKIMDEIKRLNVSVGLPNKKIAGQDLTPEQYDEYQIKTGEMALKILPIVTAKPKYKVLPDDKKEEEIKNAFDAARNYGRYMMLVNNPSIIKDVKKRIRLIHEYKTSWKSGIYKKEPKTELEKEIERLKKEPD